jgi:hypothetical protein
MLNMRTPRLQSEGDEWDIRLSAYLQHRKKIASGPLSRPQLLNGVPVLDMMRRVKTSFAERFEVYTG